jgi:hypothetical protein
MHSVFQKSNTYRSLHQIYEELGAFGTARHRSSCLSYDTRHSPLPADLGEYAIATDWQGTSAPSIASLRKPVGEIVKEFGSTTALQPSRELFNKGALDQWIPDHSRH